MKIFIILLTIILLHIYSILVGKRPKQDDLVETSAWGRRRQDVYKTYIEAYLKIRLHVRQFSKG